MGREDPDIPDMREGFVDMNELLDENLEILGREVRTKTNGGTFPLWLIRHRGELLLSIPKGNSLDIRYQGYLADHPGEVLRRRIVGEDFYDQRSGKMLTRYTFAPWKQESRNNEPTDPDEGAEVPF